MTGKPEGPDWSAATWKGSRLQQHRAFHALPFARKLEIIEEMGEFAAQFNPGAKAAEPGALRDKKNPAQ
jgi:hypothetical protein